MVEGSGKRPEFSDAILAGYKPQAKRNNVYLYI